jgi:peptidyl-prolyl cis-trans isomerase C
MNLLSLTPRLGLVGLVFLLAFAKTAPAAKDVPDNFTLNGKPVPDVIASVNGTLIPLDLLKREMTAYRLMSAHQGREVRPEDEEKIAQGLLRKAIDTELIYQKSVEKKFKLDPATIDRELEHVQSRFPDEKLFLNALAAQQLTIDVFRKNIEKELLKEELIRTEIAPGAKIDETQVQAFYRENKDTFMKPESNRVSHIFVSTPPSGEGQAESAQDRAKAEGIIAWVKDEARRKINEAASKLRAGKTFSEVVKEYSEDAESAAKGGDLGLIVKGQILPEIARALDTMKVGETSGVIESSFGFHIIQLTGKEPSRPISLEEVKSDILNNLLKAKTQELLQEYLSRLRKKSDIKIFI